jgi:hypothetical protein
MSEEAPPQQVVTVTRYRNRGGCGTGCFSGCGGFLFVLIVGLFLTVFNVAVSAGLSVRVPFTESNFTVAGTIGPKDKAVSALPDYTEGRLGGNQNFFNNSTTMTIGPAEGAGLIILGKQDGAPPFDIHLVAK